MTFQKISKIKFLQKYLAKIHFHSILFIFIILFKQGNNSIAFVSNFSYLTLIRKKSQSSIPLEIAENFSFLYHFLFSTKIRNFQKNLLTLIKNFQTFRKAIFSIFSRRASNESQNQVENLSHIILISLSIIFHLCLK